jgi:hypothetical protein
LLWQALFHPVTPECCVVATKKHTGSPSVHPALLRIWYQLYPNQLPEAIAEKQHCGPVKYSMGLDVSAGSGRIHSIVNKGAAMSTNFTIPSTYPEMLVALRQIEAKIEETKAAEKAAKAAAKAEKLAKSIARTEARLQKLLTKQVGPVGSKATKANRKAGPVTITTGAALQ